MPQPEATGVYGAAVQLAYLDESKVGRDYLLGALCLDSRDAISLAAALDDVVKAAFKKYAGITLRAELHGVDLIGGKRDWEQWRPERYIPQRYEVFWNAMDAICDFDVRIWVRGTDLDSFARRYSHNDHHGQVLEWLLERVQRDARNQDDDILVIADEHQRAEHYRSRVGFYQRHGTSGWKPEVLDRIVDTLHFAPSHSSRLLQAADMALYSCTQYQRSHKHPEQTAHWQRVWERMSTRLKEYSVWRA